MRAITTALLLLCGSQSAEEEGPPPIIDMHLHAARADWNGPPPTPVCAPLPEMPVLDPARSWANVLTAWLKNPACPDPVWGPETDEAVMEQTIEILKRRNIIGVTSGPPALLERWQKAAGDRILPALWFGFMLQSVPTPVEVRQWFKEHRYVVFSEVAIQYDG